MTALRIVPRLSHTGVFEASGDNDLFVVNLKEKLAGLRLSGFRYSSDQSKDDPKSRQYVQSSVKELPDKEIPRASVSPSQPPTIVIQSDEKVYMAEQLFNYNQWSFYIIESELKPERLTQPSSKKSVSKSS